MLPAPCPICKRTNGTVQLVVFPQARSELVCRIGHYIAEEYKPSEDKRKHLKIDILDIDKRNSTARGKIWHSFRIEPKEYTVWMKELEKLIEGYENSAGSFKRKSVTFSPKLIFYEIIKHTGWCIKPYENYHGRKRRYSKYHFPREEYYNVHDDEKHVTPD